MGKLDLTAEIIRDLAEDEFGEATVAEKAPTLKKLSERHRRIARFLASGIAPGDVAVMCGMSNSRISILQADPSFAQLVRYYSQVEDVEFASVRERLLEMGGTAVDRMFDKLEDEGDEMELSDLERIAKFSLDRAGFAPSSQNSAPQNITINIAQRLEEATRRMKTINGNGEDV